MNPRRLLLAPLALAMVAGACTNGPNENVLVTGTPRPTTSTTSTTAAIPDDAAPESDRPATASIANADDGDQVESPFAVEVVAENASDDLHLHLFQGLGCVDEGDPIPDGPVIHFDAGDFAPEISIDSETGGDITLCVQLSDADEVAVGESTEISLEILARGDQP